MSNVKLSTGHITDSIAFLDNGLLDTPGVGSTYVLRGDEIAIVETGTSLCAPTIIEGLTALGIATRDVRHIVCTHLHMDHAGGAGVLVQSMPDAQVYLHSQSHQHLIDPSRLLPSAERALGALFAKHGTIVPLLPEHLVAAEALELRLGRGLVLRAIPTPGHSPDHLAYFEESSASLFSGDALGIILPTFDFIGPVTPPPAFDVEAQRDTFAKIQALPIERILFSHFGPSPEPAQTIIQRQQECFESFDQLMRRNLEQGSVDEAEIIRAMLPDHPLPAGGERVIAGWASMSVKGLTRYYTKRRG